MKYWCFALYYKDIFILSLLLGGGVDVFLFIFFFSA